MEGPGWSRRAPPRPPWSVDDVVAMESLLARVRAAERDSLYRIRVFNPDSFCDGWCFDMHTCQKVDCWFAHSELEFEYFSARRDAALSGDMPLAQRVERFFDVDIGFLVDHELKTSRIWGHRGCGDEYGVFVRPSSHAPKPAYNPAELNPPELREALPSPRSPNPNPPSPLALYPRSRRDYDIPPSPRKRESSDAGPERQGELDGRPAKRPRTRDGEYSGPVCDFDAALARFRGADVCDDRGRGRGRGDECGMFVRPSSHAPKPAYNPAELNPPEPREALPSPRSPSPNPSRSRRDNDIPPSPGKRASSDAGPERQGELSERPAKRTCTRDGDYAGPVRDFDATVASACDADVCDDRDAIRSFVKAEPGVYGKGEFMLECVLCSSSPMSLKEMQEHVVDSKHTRAKAAFSKSAEETCEECLDCHIHRVDVERLSCTLCGCFYLTNESVKRHQKSRRHQRNLVELFANGMSWRTGGATLVNPDSYVPTLIHRDDYDELRPLFAAEPDVYRKGESMLECVLCSSSPMSLKEMQEHVKGGKHKRAKKSPRGADVWRDRDAIRSFLREESGLSRLYEKGEYMLECVLCSSSPMSLKEMQEHVLDAKHTRAKAAFSKSAEATCEEGIDSHIHRVGVERFSCTLCGCSALDYASVKFHQKGARHRRNLAELFGRGMPERGGSTKAIRRRLKGLERDSSIAVCAEELASFGPFVSGTGPDSDKVICEVCPTCGPLTLGSLVSHADGKMHRKNVARQEKSHPLEARRTRPLERQREEQTVAAPEQPAEQPAEQLAEQPAEDWLDQPMCMENWKEMEKMFLGRGGVEALSFKVVRDIMLSPTNGIQEADMEMLARVQKRASMALQPSDQPGRRSQWVPGPAVEGCSPEEQEALARLEDSINVAINPFHVPEKSEEIETEAYRVGENEECRAQDPRGFGKLGKLSGQTQAFRLEVDRGGNEHVRMAQLEQSVFHEKSVMRDEVFLRYCVPPGVRAAIEAQDVAKEGHVGNVATFD